MIFIVAAAAFVGSFSWSFVLLYQKVKDNKGILIIGTYILSLAIMVCLFVGLLMTQFGTSSDTISTGNALVQFAGVVINLLTWCLFWLDTLLLDVFSVLSPVLLSNSRIAIVRWLGTFILLSNVVVCLVSQILRDTPSQYSTYLVIIPFQGYLTLLANVLAVIYDWTNTLVLSLLLYREYRMKTKNVTDQTNASKPIPKPRVLWKLVFGFVLCIICDLLAIVSFCVLAFVADINDFELCNSLMVFCGALICLHCNLLTLILKMMTQFLRVPIPLAQTPTTAMYPMAATSQMAEQGEAAENQLLNLPQMEKIERLSESEIAARLATKSILIIGGTAGIGRALAISCLDRKAAVTVVGRRQPDEALKNAAFVQKDLGLVRNAVDLAAQVDLKKYDTVVFTNGIFAGAKREETKEGNGKTVTARD
ncbi:hypothetical protein HDU91_002441 [Kappamyces sp. JEL0680]|nr:hypothetical protein HDU91_002441 [Kappamyces sp. JEL0680]